MKRTYTLAQRAQSTEEARARVAEAAWSLLAANPSDFSMDALAKAAQVSRATVFNLFGGKAQALAAAFEHFARAHNMLDLSAELAPRRTGEPAYNATKRFAKAFVQLYASHAQELKRVRAHAALDSQIADVVASRDLRRRAGLAHLLERHAQEATIQLSKRSFQEAVASMAAMCTFEAVLPLIQEFGGNKAGSLLAAMLQHHIEGILNTQSGFH